jgi:hypothetical protein
MPYQSFNLTNAFIARSFSGQGHLSAAQCPNRAPVRFQVGGTTRPDRLFGLSLWYSDDGYVGVNGLTFGTTNGTVEKAFSAVVYVIASCDGFVDSSTVRLSMPFTFRPASVDLTQPGERCYGASAVSFTEDDDRWITLGYPNWHWRSDVAVTTCYAVFQPPLARSQERDIFFIDVTASTCVAQDGNATITVSDLTTGVPRSTRSPQFCIFYSLAPQCLSTTIRPYPGHSVRGIPVSSAT